MGWQERKNTTPRNGCDGCDKIVSWLFLGAGPVAPPEGWPSGSEKGESHFLETSCFHGVDFLRALFSFQTLILPSTSAVMSELSVVEDAPAVADPSAVLPAASANGSANGAPTDNERRPPGREKVRLQTP